METRLVLLTFWLTLLTGLFALGNALSLTHGDCYSMFICIQHIKSKRWAKTPAKPVKGSGLLIAFYIPRSLL